MNIEERIKNSCKTAINNIIAEGCTDVDLFNRPFEIEYLKDTGFQSEICKQVTAAILSHKFENLKVHKIEHVLVPKKSLFDFRKCALIDVYDEIVYLTLVLILAKDIEKRRLSKTKNSVFSYRYQVQPNGRIFHPDYNYTAFRTEIAKRKRMGKNKVMIECDLSNFYDRLNIHRIESTLRTLDPEYLDIIKLLNELLLFWANRDSYGLPVGSNASRILAEAALIDIDVFLRLNNVSFCRFVDDYRIFAKDANEAHTKLELLVQRLSKDGITLNTQKTRIVDISNYGNSSTEFSEEMLESEELAEDNKPELLSIARIDMNAGIQHTVIRGYSGLVPTKFRELSEAQANRLKGNDTESMLKELKESLLLEPEKITDFIKSIVAKERYQYFVDIPDILKKFPQFIPYFIDVMIKKGVFINEEDRQKIKESFVAWFEEETPEYIRVYIVRLLSSDVIKDKETLLKLFLGLRRNSGAYLGRALLEALDGNLLRGEAIVIRDCFYRADNWERRQILKIVRESISGPECRPFMKDLNYYTDDIFLNYMKKKDSKEKK